MARKYARKPEGTYHHPDLGKALVETALRMIKEHGVAGLTLRGVSNLLGVSRTALYRHYEDKSALLAEVALEGFRRFRAALEEAVQSARVSGLDVMEEMGAAYLRFAVKNSSHYATMFGVEVLGCGRFPELDKEAAAAFAVLMNTIVEEQKAGRLRPGDPHRLAQAVWANVHGVATLTMSGQFEEAEFPDIGRFSWRAMRHGVGV